jgi:hypothetical protein
MLCRARPEFKVAFDKLVVAVGAQNNTFGIPGVEQVLPVYLMLYFFVSYDDMLCHIVI